MAGEPAPAAGYAYPDHLANKPKSYYDYESLSLEELGWNSPDRYEVVRKIGRGKYSDVFQAVDVTKDEACVTKVLKPVRENKIKREIKILQNLRGGENIIQLLDMVVDPTSKIRSLVFEFVRNSDLQRISHTLTDMDVRHYMFELLKALKFTHSMGIMHRDVKPLNIVVDHSQRKLRLIDWGLAEFYHPGKSYNVRVASRHYKGPELLVNHQTYDYRLDMWSLGCTLAGILFHKSPFFAGRDNPNQLRKIVKVLGSEGFKAYLKKYNLQLGKEERRATTTWYERRMWHEWINSDNCQLCTPDALDLLDQLLRYDYQERPTAVEAMKHPYFAPLHS